MKHYSAAHPNDNFSEFTYGFALTYELVAATPGGLKLVPILPSLRVEKKTGYDVYLGRPGKPLIIQFKLSRYVEAGSGRTKEEKDGKKGPPFYRMYFRPAKRSDQHKKLRQLESKKNTGVYYYAPAFHTLETLQEFWLGGVEKNSLRIKPSAVTLPNDTKEHWLTFYKARNGPVYRYSDESYEVRPDRRAWREVLQEEAATVAEDQTLQENLRSLAGTISQEIGVPRLPLIPIVGQTFNFPEEQRFLERVGLTVFQALNAVLFTLQKAE